MAPPRRTRNAYIDFAAANGLGGVLVEGWNVGWTATGSRTGTRSRSPRPIRLRPPGLARYAHDKGVKLIVHNETSGGIENYERQMDSAFALYHSLGLDAIKSGYVTDFVGEGHSHYGQYMVRHHRRVIEKAAQYGIMLDVHEPIPRYGERRTYPNMMSREGARGQEYNALERRRGQSARAMRRSCSSPSLLDGPMDFTPGIFDILIERGTDGPRRPTSPASGRRSQSSWRCTSCSTPPLQMAADLPENYERQPAVPVHPGRGGRLGHDARGRGDDRRLPSSWRGGNGTVRSWYLGAITDEEARTFRRPLSFLTSGRKIRRRDLRGRARRELAHEPAAGHYFQAYGGRHVPAAHRARFPGRASDPDPAGAIVRIMMRNAEGRSLRLGTPDNLPTRPLASSPSGPPLGVAGESLSCSRAVKRQRDRWPRR